MTVPYICASCRRTLHRRALRLTQSKYQPRATYHSFADIVPPPSDDNQLDVRPRREQPLADQSCASPVQINFDDLFLNKAALKKPSRYSKLLRDDVVDDELVEKSELGGKNRETGLHNGLGLGEEVSTSEMAKEQSDPALPTDDWGRDGNMDHNVEKSAVSEKVPNEARIRRVIAESGSTTKLKRMLDAPNTTGQDLWTFFQKDYPHPECRALKHPSLQDQVLIATGQPFAHLLGSMTDRWLSSPSSNLPSPTQVAERLEYLKLLSRTEWYSRTIWKVLIVALRTELAATVQPDSNRAYALLEELCSLWALLCKRCTGNSQDAVRVYTNRSGVVDWSSLPKNSMKQAYDNKEAEQTTPAEAKLNLSARSPVHTDVASRLFHDLQAKVPKSVTQALAASALATFSLLSEHQQHEKNTVTYKTFQQYLASLLSRAEITRATNYLMAEMSRYKFSDEECKLERQKLERVPAQIITLIGSASESLSDSSLSPLPVDEKEALEAHISKLVTAHLSKGSIKQLTALWKHTKHIFTAQVNKSGENSKQRIPPPLYAKFLYVFSRLKRADMADEIWNHMVASDMQPDAQHWSALMKGRERDAEAVEEIWQRMLLSKTPPDAHTHTARIYSLIAYGKHADPGLKALEQMGLAWLAASKKHHGQSRADLSAIGDLPGAPKPTTVTLNAAVSAVSQRRRSDKVLMPRVFAWASQFGIKPNQWTYNLLIRECLHDGNMREAMKILQRMESAGIPPDGATFGIFINHIFRQRQESGQPMNPEQQEEMLSSILRVLEERGLASDKHTMGLMFDILIKQHGNLVAAQRVLDHMASHNMKPSPHIYTILMTHYFQASTPNFSAIEALWSHIQNTSAVVDNYFYDRMIEGYAKAGEVGQAMMFLGIMGKESRKPGWQALALLVRALTEQGQVDRVREVVDDVENFGGNVTGGMRGFNSWANNFWLEVERSGVRKGEGNWLDGVWRPQDPRKKVEKGRV
ncbi:hypothetical protein EJ08DRAFT_652775 [Tothia fuscella]|uniref:Pentatricopeptide repeat protein n=1 Tax=Tothia fuscella TaxID=1048955 RepID=A0A9P4NJI6_9PEZI|nr:hypothetical protein EJ08DRAFT_652775 [Tothia fuscella]